MVRLEETCGSCHTCRNTFETRIEQLMRPMVVCETCGNKRCPKATDCMLACTDSNEAGQRGSLYGAPR